jgi:molybdate transport repressor ModE-like protein
MQRRHLHLNIPVEIVRTVVVVSETGSFSKAGEKLGLSQPAISAQVKRLHNLVGGPVFEKVPGGVGFTARGTVVLAHARKLIEANDQILSLGGAVHDSRMMRVGLSAIYVEQFLKIWKGQRIDVPLQFYCDSSAELAKGLLDGFIDIACLVSPPRELEDLSYVWSEDFVWVRHEKFLLSPGAPIPIVSWPGSAGDVPMISALERAGLAYRVVFASADHHSRIAAIAAGIGLMALPRRQLVDKIVVATDYYLPKLEPLHAGISIRPGTDQKVAKCIGDVLALLAPENEAARQFA